MEQSGGDIDESCRRLRRAAIEIDDLGELVEAMCPTRRQADDIALVVRDV